jgi:putative transposase
MTAVCEMERVTGSRRAACRALAVPRATNERHRRPVPRRERGPRSASPRALTAGERQAVVEVLNSPRFVDQPPTEIYHALLDEGVYLCSRRTMYRILDQENGLQERRAVRTHPPALVPSASAAGPNEVWVWDITKLKGPVKWVYFSLYVILDLFSRYIVGWLLSSRESSGHAAHLIRETCQREGIHPKVLTLHSDRGSPMTSKTVSQLMVDLGVDPSFSRPRVSDDNAFAEASFKTLKYQPEFPDCFGSLEEARVFLTRFVVWYNQEHYHSGLGGLTPAVVHHGQAADVLRRRQDLLDRAWAGHPERFVNGRPRVAGLPERVYLVPPRVGETPTPTRDGSPAVSAPPGPATGKAPLRRTNRQINAVEPGLDVGDPLETTRRTPASTHRDSLCPIVEGASC